MIGAGGGAACHLQQQLIRKEKKAERKTGGLQQPNAALTLQNILIKATSREGQEGDSGFHSFFIEATQAAGRTFYYQAKEKAAN